MWPEKEVVCNGADVDAFVEGTVLYSGPSPQSFQYSCTWLPCLQGYLAVAEGCGYLGSKVARAKFVWR